MQHRSAWSAAVLGGICSKLRSHNRGLLLEFGAAKDGGAPKLQAILRKK